MGREGAGWPSLDPRLPQGPSVEAHRPLASALGAQAPANAAGSVPSTVVPRLLRAAIATVSAYSMIQV